MGDERPRGDAIERKGKGTKEDHRVQHLLNRSQQPSKEDHWKKTHRIITKADSNSFTGRRVESEFHDDERLRKSRFFL